MREAQSFTAELQLKENQVRAQSAQGNMFPKGYSDPNGPDTQY